MRRVLCPTLFLVLALGAHAQTVEEAMDHFGNERWAEAAAAFDALAAANPDEPRNWYYLGMANHRQGRYAEAIAAWSQALDRGFAPINTHYNLASAYARNGQTDEALTHLRASVEAGFFNVQQMNDDADLAALRTHAAYGDLVEQADRNARPCLYDENRAAFDFWIGSWEVRSAQGRLQGHNRIAKRERGCVLVEEWTGAGGSSGMSMNFYDSGRGAWVQVWMGGFGAVIRLEGGLDESGSMVLEGTTTTRTPGETQPMRGTWTPLDDGRVRQHFETYDAQADAWTTWFEGFYSRVDGEATETGESP